MSLLTKLFHKETTAEKLRRLNFLRQKEVQEWENSSPDSAYEFQARANSSFQWYPKNANRWLLLEQESRFPSHRPPKWIMRIADRTWDNRMQKGTGVPIFLHKRFVTYKIDYNDFDGYLIFRGLKPSSITRIDTQIQQSHRKAKYGRS